MLDDLLTDVERKTRLAREQREEREREASQKRNAREEANRKKNAAIRAKKQERDELNEKLAIPPTLFEMEQLVRVRNTYMRKVSRVFTTNLAMKELAHESKNRVQRMLTWRKKVEEKELQIVAMTRRGVGEDIIGPIREEKNECLREALLHWFASVEMYRKFKAEEHAVLSKGRKDGN